MKTILFFDRCNTPYLSIELTKYLEKDFNLIYLAFSAKEADIYERGGIKKYFVYQDLYHQMIINETVDKELLKEIDSVIIEYTEGRFNLNLSLQSDRSSSNLSYEECLIASQVHYKIWKRILDEYQVNFVYHEPCSHFFNHITAVLCKKRGALYCSFIQSMPEKGKYAFMTIEGDNYNALELESSFKSYLELPNTIDKTRCDNFLKKVRNDYKVFFSDNIKKKDSILKLFIKAQKESIKGFLNKNKIDRIKDPLDYWISHLNYYTNKYKNCVRYKKDKVEFLSQLPIGESYYYYSIHLEPEAVVLYWGGGVYENQIKLIQNIASSLPPNCYLYVKDHPHEFAYRSSDDYLKLMKIPNIRLLDQSIPGKTVIKNAIGVFSINGTACFEALLLGKQVYCFGHSYYSFLSRVNYVHNIKDLRAVLYKNVGIQYTDDLELFAFVNAYLDASHSGYADYATSKPQRFISNLEENTSEIAKVIKSCINKYA